MYKGTTYKHYKHVQDVINAFVAECERVGAFPADVELTSREISMRMDVGKRQTYNILESMIDDGLLKSRQMLDLRGKPVLYSVTQVGADAVSRHLKMRARFFDKFVFGGR